MIDTSFTHLFISEVYILNNFDKKQQHCIVYTYNIIFYLIIKLHQMHYHTYTLALSTNSFQCIAHNTYNPTFLVSFNIFKGKILLRVMNKADSNFREHKTMGSTRIIKEELLLQGKNHFHNYLVFKQNYSAHLL